MKFIKFAIHIKQIRFYIFLFLWQIQQSVLTILLFYNCNYKNPVLKYSTFRATIFRFYSSFATAKIRFEMKVIITVIKAVIKKII